MPYVTNVEFFVLFYWHLKSQITTGDHSGLSHGINWQLVTNHLGSNFHCLPKMS